MYLEFDKHPPYTNRTYMKGGRRGVVTIVGDGLMLVSFVGGL